MTTLQVLTQLLGVVPDGHVLFFQKPQVDKRYSLHVVWVSPIMLASKDRSSAAKAVTFLYAATQLGNF